MSDKYNPMRIAYMLVRSSNALKSASALATIAIFWDFISKLQIGFNMPFMLALGSVALAAVSLWLYLKAVWLSRKN